MKTIKVIPPEIRFWRRVDKFGSIHSTLGRCWNWTGGKTKAGYGQLNIKGKIIYTHRYAYELLKGQIPDKYFVIHKCDNPACVNPKHLLVGPPKLNAEDMVIKGRSSRGEHRPLHKLTEAEVVKIRNLYERGVVGRGCTSLGRIFGVGPNAIRDIILGITWKHVPQGESS